MSVKVSEILEFLNLKAETTINSELNNTIIKDISINSNNVKRNSLFVPLKGEKTDGHKYIKNAFENGADASLISESFTLENKQLNFVNKPLIKVKDTLNALQKIGKGIRSKFNGDVIGVTGSCGKTTTKEFICSVLSSKFKIFKNEGNFNGQIGVPLTLFKLNNSFDIAVIEMGISKFNEMDVLSDLVRPNIAVMTNIGHSHLEYLKSLENVYKEKFKITKYFKKNSVLFLNGDDTCLSKVKNMHLPFKVISFGIENKSTDIRALNIKYDGSVTSFDILHKNALMKNFKINSLGIHNVLDALASISVALYFNLDENLIKKHLENKKEVKNRQNIKNVKIINQHKKSINITLIDDCYNANPESMQAAILVLKNILTKNRGRKIAVIADMLEQGDNSTELHLNLGTTIGKEKIDALFTIGKYSKIASKRAKEINENILIFNFEDSNNVSETLKNFLKEGDVVLFKGSRYFHLENVIDKLIF